MASPIIQFPKWVYSAAEPKGRIVDTQEDLEALGDGWYESPADIPEPAAADDTDDGKKKKGK